MRKRVSIAILLGATLALANPLARPLGALPPQDGVLRVETRLVQLEVVVRDGNGPVPDLVREDFTVYDEGEPQPIAFFSVNARTDSARGAERLPQGAISNRLDWQGEAPVSATVLLIDRINTDWASQIRARNQILQFLGQLDGQDRIAIYELGDQFRILHDYTQDPALLISAVQGVEAAYSTALAASTGDGDAVARSESESLTGGFAAEPDEIGRDPVLGALSDNGFVSPTAELGREVARYYLNDRVSTTTEALEAIALHLAGLAGRKNLVWLSGGFPFSFSGYSDFDRDTVRRNVADRMNRAATALNDANVAVYPVDVRGLMPPTEGLGGVWRPPGLVPAGADTMRSVAEITGGRAFYNTNGIAEAIGEAVDDSRLTYTIGFYPAADASDTGFHRLRVEVRRDGVDVRHRRGYYGFGASNALAGEERNMPLDELVTAPLDATSVGLIARIEEVEDVPGAYQTTISANVNDLELTFEDDAWTGSLEIAFTIVEPGDSKPEVYNLRNLPIRLSDDELREALLDGLPLVIHDHRAQDRGSLRIGLPLVIHDLRGRDPGWLRVVVRDQASGSAGSIWVPVQERAPAD